MSVNFKVIFCTALVVLTYNLVSAQAVKSPFTTFGIGDVFGSSMAHNQGMGGVGYSQPQVLFLNNQNPALLPYNVFSVFQAGIIAEDVTLSNGTTSGKSRGGNLNYLALAFPLKFRKASTAIGIRPYSKVNYSFSYTEPIENSNQTVPVSEEGTGGITELYWNNGFLITQNFSVGVSASYLFGNIVESYDGQARAENQQIGFRVGIKEDTYAKGFQGGIGLAYTIDSLTKKNHRFNVGFVYKVRASLNTDFTTDLYTINALSGDTVLTQRLSVLNGNITLPATVGFGISYGRDRKWNAGIDITLQDWRNFRSVNKDEEKSLTNSWRIAAGAEIIPDIISTNLLKRITYRAGFSYEQLPFLVNGNNVTDFGINFGLSIPAGRSSIDLGLRTGRRGNVSDNQLSEQYWKLYLGLSLNDQWFIKRKFD
ncbi:MAG: hypothetical protein ACK48F_12835 [Chryseotalea sp.]|jgi:hypothetical protein